jgi:SAM-dependent methyltransferase
VLIPLAEAGYQVYGIDHDPNMLAILRKNTPTAVETTTHLIQADLSNFNIPKQFTLIILPCNTFSTLNTETQQTSLECIRHHLTPDGLLAISIPNPTVIAQLETNHEPEIESVFSHPSTGHPVQVSCDWEHINDQVTLNWHYDHLLPNGQVERLTTPISHYLTSTEEYMRQFTLARFTIEATFGDFDHSPYVTSSPNFIILAKKI